MSTTQIKSGIFDELYVTDAQGNLVEVTGGGGAGSSYDDTAISQRVDDLETGKQDSLTQTATGGQVGVLSGNSMRPLRGSGDVFVTDNTSEILISVPTTQSLSAQAPLSLDTATQALSIDTTSFQYSASWPLSIDTSNQITFDATAPLTILHCNRLTAQYDIVCGHIQAGYMSGGAGVQVQMNIDQSIADANPFWTAGAVDSLGNVLVTRGRKSYSVSHTAAGQYDITFSDPHPDTNFCVLVSSQQYSHFTRLYQSANTGAQSQDGIRVYIRNSAGSPTNALFSFQVLA